MGAAVAKSVGTWLTEYGSVVVLVLDTAEVPFSKAPKPIPLRAPDFVAAPCADIFSSSLFRSINN